MSTAGADIRCEVDHLNSQASLTLQNQFSVAFMTNSNEEPALVMPHDQFTETDHTSYLAIANLQPTVDSKCKFQLNSIANSTVNVCNFPAALFTT